MDDVTEAQVFRVTVRGRFDALSEQARAYLVAGKDEHSIFLSGYTEEGTFTYDERIDFFNLRYEVRLGGADAATTAGEHARDEARTFLRTMGFGHRDLKVEVVDMSAMWRSTRRA